MTAFRKTPPLDFVQAENKFFFPAKDLNAFQRDEFQDTWGFYQSMFGLYTYMRLNRNLKYVLHQLRGTPMVWQPHNSCTVTPTGSLRIGTQEIEPCRAVMKELFCQDELFDSVYETILEWSGAGALEMDEEFVNQMLSELLANKAAGERLQLTMGNVFNVNTIDMNDENPQGVAVDYNDLFQRTHITCTGWVKTLADLADAGYSHLNLEELLPEADFTDGDYQGDILDLYDDLKANAQKPLKALINRGGIVGRNGVNYGAGFIVSDTIHAAVAEQYNTESVAIAQNRTRITREAITSGVTARPNMVYYIDGVVPVIPVSEINAYDHLLAGSTHFAGLIASGNIQLGSNFDEVNDIERGAGMLVQKITDAESDNYGGYVFMSNGLFASAIADKDYAVAARVHW